MNQRDLNSFFRQIQEEDLFYKIDMMPDGTYHTSWDNLSSLDYKDDSDTQHRIIVRVHKAKNQLYFLDFFQQYQNKVVWYGFQFKSCVRYNFQFKEDEDWFDAFFYFTNHSSTEENMIHIRNINREVILLLQQFFQVFT
jgi:hypothetical protein